KPWHPAIWIATFAGMAMSALAWIAWSDPVINFLSRDSRAEWIVFPVAVDARAHWFASLDATFRREFLLKNQPATARLSVRAMRRADVKINGVLIRFPPARNWKEIKSADVARQLQTGTNTIEARIFNHNGPPALWLALTTDQLDLRSDQSWEASFAGSSSRQAVLAAAVKTPGPGNSTAGGESTVDALREMWLFWIVLIALACVAIFLLKVSSKKLSARSLEQVLLLFVVGV